MSDPMQHVQVIQQPLPPEAEQVAQDCLERLAVLQREYQERAEPYLRTLRALEGMRPMPALIIPRDMLPPDLK